MNNQNRSQPAPSSRDQRGGATDGRGNTPQQTPNMWQPMRRPNFWIVFVALLAINYLLATVLFPDIPSRITVPYTFFKEQVAAGNVVSITSRGDDIQGVFRHPVAAPPNPAAALTPQPTAASTSAAGPPTPAPTFTKFSTVKPAFGDPELLPLLERNNVVITAEPLETPRSPLVSLLLAFGPTILLILGFLWLNSRMISQAGGAFGLGRSRARRYDAAAAEKRVTFDDVAGIDEVEAEVQEVVDFLKEPEKYRRLGASIPKGVLLVGPPGTGKTLLAKAVAGEANVPFFSMSGSEFIEMVVGVGAARVRDLFREARAAAPSIIFVDELDAIGRQRGGLNSLGGNDEREQTLNQLLIEMDGFDSATTTVIVMAATNREDVLDPALLRPGRFDRRIIVQPPDRPGRAAILRVHTRNVPLAPDVDLEELAAQTPGATGADLANLVNEAALNAARRGDRVVAMADFYKALDRVTMGSERRLAISPEERERVAYHESGHALCGLLQDDSDPVRRVTVVPRAQALGVTLSVPEDDRYNYTREYLLARIVTALGGRAAEEVVYGNVTTGAANDLQQVTRLARAMVAQFGLSEEIGQVALVDEREGNFVGTGLVQRPYSDATAEAADRAVRRIVDDCYAKALRLLRENRARLDALARALLEHETLDEQQILEVTGLSQPAHSPPVATPVIVAPEA